MKRLMMFLLIFLILASFLNINVKAQNNTRLELIPDRDSVCIGMIYNIDLLINDAADLYSFELHLEYDPEIIEVINVDLNPFDWDESLYEIISNNCNSNSGEIDMAFSLLGNYCGYTGTHKVGSISVRVKKDGNISFSKNENRYLDYSCYAVDSNHNTSLIELIDRGITNDNQAPEIIKIESTANNFVEVVFNEDICTENILSTQNYSISPSLDVVGCNYDEKQNKLILQTDNQIGNKEYELKIESVSDCLGNNANNTSTFFNGSMLLYASIQEDIYKGHSFVADIYAGPVEGLSNLFTYIKCDDEYIDVVDVVSEGEETSTNIDESIVNLYFDGVGNYSSFNKTKLCTIMFNAKKTGISNLEFLDSLVYKTTANDIENNSINIELLNDNVNILESYLMDIQIKTVSDDYSNIEFCINEESQHVVVEDGCLLLHNLIPGSYSILVKKPGYLNYQENYEITGNKSVEIFLKPGDVVGDSHIDIKDIAAIAQKFCLNSEDEGYSQLMDYNMDSWINIIDVSYVAKNYGLSINNK